MGGWAAIRGGFQRGGAKNRAILRAGLPGGGAGRLCLWHRVSYIVTKVVPLLLRPSTPACPPPAVADMEPVASNIQVLLQAAEFLERRERGEAKPLAGLQATTLLTRASVGLGSQLAGCTLVFKAVAPGQPRLRLERGLQSGWEVLGKWPWRQKPLPDRAVPGAPAGISSILTRTGALSGRG